MNIIINVLFKHLDEHLCEHLYEHIREHLPALRTVSAMWRKPVALDLQLRYQHQGAQVPSPTGHPGIYTDIIFNIYIYIY